MGRSLVSRWVSAGIILWFGVCVGASGAGPRGERICVVAVRDSGLFTMCPSAALIKKWRYPNRTQSLEIVQNPEGPRLAVPRHLIQLDRPVLDYSRSEWWSMMGNLPGFCPSGRIDAELQKDLEKRLAKSGEYTVVDSVQKADLVFLAEGFYADQYAGFMGVQTGRYRSSGNSVLGCVLAVAVPAAIYARNPADGDLLLEARGWEGAVAWKSNPPEVDRQTAVEPASTDQLVAQFLNRDSQGSGFPPLCSACVLAPSVDGMGAPRATRAATGEPAATPILALEAPVSAGNVIRVNVSMVTVPALVSDAAGRPVTGLSARDFHVFEDGVEQKIDRIIPEVTPFHVVLMLDTSGSTLFKHSEIQGAALAFIDSLRPEERVMVVSFDSYIYLDSPFTTDRTALRRAILRTDTGAGTRLIDAVDLVLTECLHQVEGRKAVVLFTDGVDSQSWLARFGDNQGKIEESDALVYAVQYDTTGVTRASQYLNGLAQNSGGRLFIASSISNLREAFAGIADELQHQYTLCYYPSNQSKDSALRQIRLTVDAPGAKVRARTGYRVARGRPPS